MVLGTDGLYGVMTNEEIIQTVDEVINNKNDDDEDTENFENININKKGKGAIAASRALVAAARERGSTDGILI